MKENSIEDDIKIIEKMIENANIENMDMNDCFGGEHIEAIEHILSDYKRVKEEFKEVDHECSRLEKKEFELEKENEKLQKENEKLREIRNTTAYGIETVNLIPKSRLVEINTNRYMIEIEAGRFVDLKQVYQENVKLKKENEELKKFHIQDNKHLDFIMKNSIPVEKVKDKIEKEIKYHEKNILDIENITMLKGKTAKEEAEIEFNKYAIVVLKKMLQELLESEE